MVTIFAVIAASNEMAKSRNAKARSSRSCNGIGLYSQLTSAVTYPDPQSTRLTKMSNQTTNDMTEAQDPRGSGLGGLHCSHFSFTLTRDDLIENPWGHAARQIKRLRDAGYNTGPCLWSATPWAYKPDDLDKKMREMMRHAGIVEIRSWHDPVNGEDRYRITPGPEEAKAISSANVSDDPREAGK